MTKGTGCVDNFISQVPIAHAYMYKINLNAMHALIIRKLKSISEKFD